MQLHFPNPRLLAVLSALPQFIHAMGSQSYVALHVPVAAGAALPRYHPAGTHGAMKTFGNSRTSPVLGRSVQHAHGIALACPLWRFYHLQRQASSVCTWMVAYGDYSLTPY